MMITEKQKSIIDKYFKVEFVQLENNPMLTHPRFSLTGITYIQFQNSVLSRHYIRVLNGIQNQNMFLDMLI
jgi:hypothetical protein